LNSYIEAEHVPRWLVAEHVPPAWIGAATPSQLAYAVGDADIERKLDQLATLVADMGADAAGWHASLGRYALEDCVTGGIYDRRTLAGVLQRAMGVLWPPQETGS
jgi:hypothetical protein